VDDVLDRSNTALHGTSTTEQLRHLLADMAVLSVALLTLAPQRNREPYAPYSTRVAELTREWLSRAAG
jgi:hypothetical protein